VQTDAGHNVSLFCHFFAWFVVTKPNLNAFEEESVEESNVTHHNKFARVAVKQGTTNTIGN